MQETTVLLMTCCDLVFALHVKPVMQSRQHPSHCHHSHSPAFRPIVASWQPPCRRMARAWQMAVNTMDGMEFLQLVVQLLPSPLLPSPLLPLLLKLSSLLLQLLLLPLLPLPPQPLAAKLMSRRLHASPPTEPTFLQVVVVARRLLPCR